jgi:hypothetical protein
MRKSKYLGMKNGEWLCTHMGIATVTPTFKPRTRIRYKSAGHRQYYYIFERLTHDLKAEKMVRLSAAQVLLVYKGLKTVEEYADKKKASKAKAFKNKVSYSFCD